MSDKHNQNPTTRRNQSRYRKTIELNSASQWDSFDLDLFHVDFTPDEFSDLTDVIDRQFYEVNSMDELDKSTPPHAPR